MADSVRCKICFRRIEPGEEYLQVTCGVIHCDCRAEMAVEDIELNQQGGWYAESFAEMVVFAGA